ncbi:MAG: hypothetical protein PWP23_2600 [Candidatus Sumerlaeota bacterium]|nr:hypothetical protein [Candidatus Sumerlaeota bacterium]
MFQSTPLVRGATCRRMPRTVPSTFQSTPLVRGATPACCRRSIRPLFQSTPPVRGATRHPSTALQRRSGFQSTPPVRGATRDDVPRDRAAGVSIHAPRARGDSRHASPLDDSPGFNPRPSCEGRPNRHAERFFPDDVSIHAPRARGDGRRAEHARALLRVSIHAPRARGDVSGCGDHRGVHCFNPRPSCEGRPPGGQTGHFTREEFQSTPLVRGATPQPQLIVPVIQVSIHAPRARGDTRNSASSRTRTRFNPRPSCEGRPNKSNRRLPQ